MSFNSLLDSTRIINIKNRCGYRISNSNSVTIYSLKNKLKKELINELSHLFSFAYDRDVLIDKILTKCKTVEDIDTVKTYLEKTEKIDFVNLASNHIQQFLKTARKYSA